MTAEYPTELEGKFHFKQTNTGFRYLGIIIAPNISQLFEANYAKLIIEIKRDLIRWEVLPLSSMGRI